MPRERFMNTTRWREAMQRSGFDAAILASPNAIFYATGALLPAQLKASPSFAARLVDDRPAFAVVRPSGEGLLLVSSRDAPSVRRETWVTEIETYDERRESPVGKLVGVLKRKGLGKSRLGVELRYLTANQARELEKALPNASLEPCESTD